MLKYDTRVWRFAGLEVLYYPFFSCLITIWRCSVLFPTLSFGPYEQRCKVCYMFVCFLADTYDDIHLTLCSDVGCSEFSRVWLFCVGVFINQCRITVCIRKYCVYHLCTCLCQCSELDESYLIIYLFLPF